MFFKLLYLLTPRAHAQSSILGEFRTIVCPPDQSVAYCMSNLDLRDIIIIVNIVVRIAFGLAGVIALIYFIYAGYLFMTSLGNPDALARAKSKLLMTALGLLIIILSYVIVSFILNIFAPAGTSILNPLGG